MPALFFHSNALLHYGQGNLFYCIIFSNLSKTIHVWQSCHFPTHCTILSFSNSPVSCSQPAISRVPSDLQPSRSPREASSASPGSVSISFSQPVQADDMLLSSQLNGTQSSSQVRSLRSDNECVTRRENAPPTDVKCDKSVAAPMCCNVFLVAHSRTINLTRSVSESSPKGSDFELTVNTVVCFICAC